MIKAWMKASIFKRKARSTFHRIQRHDNKDEYIIKIAGFSGELRKYMTEAEAVELVEASNKAAFESAAEASKEGVYGYKEFSKHGGCNARDMFNVIGKAAGRGFGRKD